MTQPVAISPYDEKEESRQEKSGKKKKGFMDKMKEVFED